MKLAAMTTGRSRYAGILVAVTAFTATCSTKVNASEENEVARFVNTYCLKCHDTKTQEADLDLQHLVANGFSERDYRKWQRVTKMLRTGKMPPRDEKQPSTDDRTQIVSRVEQWLTDYAKQNAGDPGRLVMRRLTNDEYNYSIFDLTGVDMRPAERFPSESAAGEGFTNAGDGQAQLSANLMQKYLQAAKDVAGRVVLPPSGLTFADRQLLRPEDRHAWAERRMRSFYQRTTPSILDTLKAAYHFQSQSADEFSVEEFAADNGVNVVYLRHVLSMLQSNDVSPLLAEVQRELAALTTLDEAKAMRTLDAFYRNRIQEWQEHWTGFPGVQEEHQLLIDKLPADGKDAFCWLLVGDAGDGSDNDVVVCRPMVINIKKESDSRSLREHLDELAPSYRTMLPFGKGANKDSLVVSAPVLLEIRLPRELFTKDHRLQITCRLDSAVAEKGSVQLQLRKDKKRPVPLNGLVVETPILADAKNTSVLRQRQALDDVAAIFPRSFWTDFVGSEELAAITVHNSGAGNVIYQRRDDTLQKLANSADEQRELDVLWEDLLHLRKEPLFAMECYLRGRLENGQVSIIPRNADEGMQTIERLFDDSAWWEKNQKTIGDLVANRTFYGRAKQRLATYRSAYLKRLDSIGPQHIEQVMVLAERACDGHFLQRRKKACWRSTMRRSSSIQRT